MDNIKEFYILEKPVNTKIGLLYPILVEDYLEFAQFNGLINLDKNALMHNFKDIDGLYALLKEINLFDFIILFKDENYKSSMLYEMYIQYKNLFELCFKKDVFDLIKSNDEFDEYIKIIRDINGIEYEPTSPNPEVERRKALKRKLESMKNENVTFEDMFTSVCVGLHKLPSEVNKMTIYSFNKIFGRIGQFKNYDTNTLFATVSNEVKIEPWYKSMNIEKEVQYITEEQLNRAKQNKQLQNNL